MAERKIATDDPGHLCTLPSYCSMAIDENMRTKTFRQVERVNYGYATGIMKDDIIQTKTAICDRREVIYSIWVYQVLLGQKPTFTDIAEMCLRLPDAVAEGRLRGTIDALLKAGLIRRVKTGKRVFYEIVVEKVEDESHGEVLKLPAPKYILEVAREVATKESEDFDETRHRSVLLELNAFPITPLYRHLNDVASICQMLFMTH